MKHPGAISIHGLGVFLAIAGSLVLTDGAAEDQPPGDTGTHSSFYTYSDDWAIVSAPPPPGPYQSVNVDPRIPGQEDVRTPYGSSLDTPRVQSEQLPGDFTGAPPSAGIPARPMAPGAYTGQESSGNQPPPGYYRSQGYNQSWPAPVQDYSGSYGYPPSGDSRYGYAPSPWYNTPGQRSEDDIPPPPLYNGMTGPPSPVYRNRPTPDQPYRRGSGAQ